MESEGKNVPGVVTVCVEFKAVDEVLKFVFIESNCSSLLFFFGCGIV
jgi:hypothetical protein